MDATYPMLGLYFFAIAIQWFFYLILFPNLYSKKEVKEKSKTPPVSIIICAHNEAENLKKFIPKIIAQNYNTFELILIDDHSTDATREVMDTFAKHPRVSVLNTHLQTKKPNKKRALTVGIQAAQYNHLLFTDADCKPQSRNWIKEMAHHFQSENIVLGYGAYRKTDNSFLNKLIRYETLMNGMLYLSLAKLGFPYMGVGRNLAYHKNLFSKANGFEQHLSLPSGDDDLFINQMATKNNVSVCLSPESFTLSTPEKSLHNWAKQKRRHITTANHYKLRDKVFLSSFYFSQGAFWSISTLLFFYSPKPFLGLFLLTLLFKILVFRRAAKHFKAFDLTLLYPLLELSVIAFYLYIFMANLTSRPRHWK